MLFELLLILTAAVCVAAVVGALTGKFDFFAAPFLYGGMFLYFFVYEPAWLWFSGEGKPFLTEGQFTLCQLVALGSIVAFLFGWWLAVRRKFARRPVPQWSIRHLYGCGAAIAGVGFLLWAWFVDFSGGWVEYYSQAHGAAGRWAETTAWIYGGKELLIPGILLMLQARIQGDDPARTPLALPLVLAGLVFLHAILMSSRGTLYPLAVVLVFIPYLIRGRRPPRFAFLWGATALSVLLLLLVAYRQWAHLGASLAEADVDPAAAILGVEAAEGNEYLYCGAWINTAWQTGQYALGVPYSFYVIHVIPRSVWPDKPYGFEWGATKDDMRTIVGWRPTSGAARTGVADLFTNFSFGAWGVWALLGWGAGRIYTRALEPGALSDQAYYVLFLAASLHLVSQGVPAFFVSSCYRAVPLLLVYKLFKYTLRAPREQIEPGPDRVLPRGSESAVTP